MMGSLPIFKRPGVNAEAAGNALAPLPPTGDPESVNIEAALNAQRQTIVGEAVKLKKRSELYQDRVAEENGHD